MENNKPIDPREVEQTAFLKSLGNKLFYFILAGTVITIEAIIFQHLLSENFSIYVLLSTLFFYAIFGIIYKRIIVSDAYLYKEFGGNKAIRLSIELMILIIIGFTIFHFNTGKPFSWVELTKASLIGLPNAFILYKLIIKGLGS